jgi:putative nucleotidyltransferase with HDIG domain
MVDLTPQGLVDRTKDLVTLPEVALRIAQIVEDPNASSSDVSREINLDAALTARLLRIANSPACGHPGQIGTLQRAITLLGMRQVRDLAVGLTAIRAFDGIGNELITMESFWRHSVLCAVASGRIAARGVRSPDNCTFIAGLLHDIGQLVLFSQAADVGRRALLMSIDSVDDIDLFLCEREVIGFDHAAVGAALARKWGLPRALQECIEFHHEPGRAQEYPVEVATVHVANSVAVLAEIDSRDLNDAPSITPAALHTAKLNSENLMEIVLETREVGADLLPLLIAA